MLDAFHHDTWFKLELAPVDSRPLYQRADGSLCEVSEDGWLMDYDDLDKDDAISIKPTSIEIFEAGPSRFQTERTYRMPSTTLPDDLRADVETLWDYNQMGHEVRHVDVGIGLGSHDLGVATYTAELYHQGMFPLIVFSGANAPTTVEKFPRGEAVHYREHALELGVPGSAILVESKAANTPDNINFTRALLDEHGVGPITSVMLISRPYQQRRSYAICRKLWPEVDVICTSLPMPVDQYFRSIGDVDRVINMLVGDTQRIWVYPENGWAIEQDVPNPVRAAYARLVDAGFTSRLLPV